MHMNIKFSLYSFYLEQNFHWIMNYDYPYFFVNFPSNIYICNFGANCDS
jgi:hypothetical protein